MPSQEKPARVAPVAQQDEQVSTTATESAQIAPDAELEFESMDLSVESVEERISPSETNVFDK